MSRFAKALLVSLLLLGSVSTATAQDNPGVDTFRQEHVATVSMLLSGYHDLAPQASFERVPEGAAIVQALASGPAGMLRDRALAAMGRYWPSGDVYLLYAKIIAADDTPVGTRHRAILMLANAFGERAIPAIRPFLQSPDLQLQMTAVQAIGSIGTDEAVSVLYALAETTTEPLLLEQIDKSSRVLR